MYCGTDHCSHPLRNDGSGGGRSGRFEVCAEVELTELEGEGESRIIPRCVAYVTG